VQKYGAREVQKLLRLPRSTLRALIDAGFVSPSRGPRNSLQFSFQDLIVLRTAQALSAAKLPQKRITRSIRELRKRLPGAMPLAGLSIAAIGDRVVVKEGGSRWQADSGQYLLAFEGDPASGSLTVIERKSVEPREALDWFERGVALEAKDAAGAIRSYERAVAADAAFLDAHLNLGWLLHEKGRFTQAERAYRSALMGCGNAPGLLYNLGVLLEDMDRKMEAVEAYEAALRGDARLADCHYNLALLCEELGRPKDAIRHMAQYRRLVGTSK
jgi:tetratricopeptide (TPR) repeat protein